MIAGISVVVFFLYALIALYKYQECTISKSKEYDWSLIKEIGSFAGWNLFGAACSVGRSQGLGVILNLFFGAIINAAYGIANQVGGQLNYFSATMLRALNPQIMKSEGANDRQRMLRLSIMASKFGFFLMAFIAIPCIYEMPSILNFWLKEVPEFTVMLCNLTLIAIMINQLTIGLQSAFQATGRIKEYQIIVGSTLLFNLPVAYFMLKFELPIYSVLISYIFFEIVSTFLRIFLLKKIAGLSVDEFIHKVIYKTLFPTLTIILTGYLITKYIQIDFRFLYTISISAILFTISIFFTGLCDDEKEMLFNLIKKKSNRNAEPIS
jgi:O-antigen/teichoic acid export membrane protein